MVRRRDLLKMCKVSNKASWTSASAPHDTYLTRSLRWQEPWKR